MPNLLVLELSPEAAITNPSENYPQKTPRSGANQKYFSIDYDKALDERAYWLWPLPKQEEFGEFSDDLDVVLHWSTEASSGKVAWYVAAAIIEEGDDLDKAFGTEETTPEVIVAAANKEQTSEVTIAGVFSSLPTVSKTARLALRIRRKTTVVPNADADAILLKSQLNVDFTGINEGCECAFSDDPAVWTDGLPPLTTVHSAKSMERSIHSHIGTSLTLTAPLYGVCNFVADTAKWTGNVPTTVGDALRGIAETLHDHVYAGNTAYKIPFSGSDPGTGCPYTDNPDIWENVPYNTAQAAQALAIFYALHIGTTIDTIGFGGAGGGTDPNAIHTNVSGEINALTEKTYLHPDDVLVIEDSENLNAKRKIRGGVFASLYTSVVLVGVAESPTFEDIRNKLVIGDTDTAGADQTITLPPGAEEDDGSIFFVQRDGSNLLTVDVPATYSIKVAGGAAPLDFPDDGDAAAFIYRHATKTFHVV